MPSDRPVVFLAFANLRGDGNSVDRGTVCRAQRRGRRAGRASRILALRQPPRAVASREPTREILAEWPIERPADWVQRVNSALSAGELKRLCCSVMRNRPFGTDAWTDRTARRLDLEHTLRPEGRPPRKN